jgi:phage terminase large subunit
VKSIDEQEFAKYVSELWDDRVRFAKEVIGFEKLDPLQERFLSRLDRYDHIAEKAGHGTCKTTDLSICTLHWLSTRYSETGDTRILCTAPSKHQLQDILWAEMSRQIEMMKRNPIGKAFADNLDWKKETITNLMNPAGNYAAARTATKDNTDALQGFHGAYVLRVIEEASGVNDKACEVVEGATGTIETKTILVGNPTRRGGQFHRCFHDDKKFYNTGTRSCLDITHPLLVKEARRFAERMAKKYGPESNIYRVRVLGDFPMAEDDAYIPYQWCEDAYNRSIFPTSGQPVVFGVDVARSLTRDRTVLAIRRGDEFLPYHVLRTDDTMRIVSMVASQYKIHKPRAIFVDVIGVGAGVYDRLKQLGYPAIPVNSAETKSMENPERYERLRDELWGKMRDWLEIGRGKIWDNEDHDLIGELSTPRSKAMASGKIKVESKEEMRERLKRMGGDEKHGSPDVADAHIMTFAQEIADYNTEDLTNDESMSHNQFEMIDPKAGY